MDADFLLSRNFLREWVPVGYRDDRVADLIRRRWATADDGAVARLYGQALALVWQDAPWIWLYDQAAIHATTRDLAGAVARADELFLVPRHAGAPAGASA